MGSRVMSPASNKAVPSSRGMRAVASPLPWRHRQQHGQPLPLPLAPSPAKPRHAQRERSRGWVEAHLPAPIHPVRPLRGREGHRTGPEAPAVLLRRIPSVLRRGKQGCPSPRGPRQPPCSLRGCARKVLCCILSRGLPTPSSGARLRPGQGQLRFGAPLPQLTPAHGNAPSRAQHQPARLSELPAASGAGNAPGTEATHGTCSHKASRGRSCCQRGAMQLQRSERWAGPGPAASVATLSAPPGAFPGGRQAPC